MEMKVITLNHVASSAGVSAITASRALNGTGYVSPETRAKVQAAAELLKYTPNLVARRMKGVRSNVLGVFVNHFQSPVMHELMATISLAVRRAGLDLIIYDTPDTFCQGGLNSTARMMYGMCDGLLLVMPRLEERYLAVLESESRPTVLVNYIASPTTLPVVQGENRKASARATTHLLELGHRRIGFIGGSHHTGQSAARRAGYLDAMGAAGIAVSPQWIVDGAFDRASGYSCAAGLLDLPEAPTALFCANDDMAFGAMDAIRARGLRIPEDVSVVGYDDMLASRHTTPPLTTLRQPLDQIGDRAVAELVRRMQGGERDASVCEFPTELIVRGSTGVCRPDAPMAPAAAKKSAKVQQTARLAGAR
jgi:LacI family transcriptional regulator